MGRRILAVSLLPELLSTSDPLCLPGLYGQGQVLVVFSVPTHKARLIPSVLAKLGMGNWDTTGLISWWGEGAVVKTQAVFRNSRRLELSPRLTGPPILIGWVLAQEGPSFL